MKCMKITVYLDTYLRKRADKSRFDIDIEQGATIREVIKALQLNEGEVGLIILNSKIASIHSIVEENDSLELYPVMGGG